MKHSDATIELKMTVEIPAKLVKKILKEAEDRGLTYREANIPTQQEILRRFLVDSLIQAMNEVDPALAHDVRWHE